MKYILMTVLMMASLSASACGEQGERTSDQLVEEFASQPPAPPAPPTTPVARPNP